MKLFAQIRKVDEAKRLVYGRAAEEVVDKSDEIMDYASSKPHFEKWSADIAKDTDGKSLGNVRAMHGKVAAGKLTGIDFNDADKAIDICAKVVDDAEWKKVLEGVYTGFSMGGSYAEGSKKVEKLDDKQVTRYTAIPSEISLVDRPCIPTAKFFEVQKADGSLAKVDFKEQAAEADASINGTPEQVDALVKLMSEHKLTLADVLVKITPAPAAVTHPAAEAAPAAKVEKLDAGALRKSMWACAELAQLIACLQNLKSSAVYEAFYEGDDSGIARRLGAVIALAGQVLIEMVQEDVSEENAGGDTTLIVELAEKVKGLAKFDGDALLDLVKVGARNSAADKERLAKIHDLSVELGHDCGAAKAAPAGDLSKVVDTTAFEKMLSEAVAPLQKALDEAQARVKKLEEQPAPARVVLKTIAKTEDLGHQQEQQPAPVVKDGSGEVNPTASLIKGIHMGGGQQVGFAKA